MSVENTFGQQLDAGDVVGWGHRSGNTSAHQIGIILSINVTHPLPNSHPDLIETRATCYWVGGGNAHEYKSSARIEELFLIDPDSLGDVWKRRISLARSSQLP